MYQLPSNGRKTFEVLIYNKDVRALVKENQSHSFFDDQWADVHVQDVAALDEVEAREIMAKRFPLSDGFVIEGVHAATL